MFQINTTLPNSTTCASSRILSFPYVWEICSPNVSHEYDLHSYNITDYDIVHLKCNFTNFQPVLYCYNVSTWTEKLTFICQQKSAGWSVSLFTSPRLLWKLQITLLCFCIPTHVQSDQQRIINRTVFARVGLSLKPVS